MAEGVGWRVNHPPGRFRAVQSGPHVQHDQHGLSHLGREVQHSVRRRPHQDGRVLWPLRHAQLLQDAAARSECEGGRDGGGELIYGLRDEDVVFFILFILKLFSLVVKLSE